jgi:hypothetical protein
MEMPGIIPLGVGGISILLYQINTRETGTIEAL